MRDQQIRAMQPGDLIKDDLVAGLQARRFARSTAFYLYYRTHAGVQRRPKLGDFPGLTVAGAREAARELLRKVAAGEDPSAAKKTDREAPTVQDAYDDWWDEHGSKLKSAREYKRIWKTDLRARFGRMRVSDVCFDTVDRFHRSNHARPFAANRALALLSTLFTYCERRRWRTTGNPCSHVRRYTEQNRRRYMTPDEAPKVAAALAELAEAYPASVAFIYLVMYTGARPGEIAAAQWDWYDGTKIDLPDSKTGRRTVYLPPEARAVIDKLPRDTDTITGILDPKRVWNLVREKAGCPDLRLYDQRHTFASTGLALGMSLGQIGELLGHASTATTKRYAHLMNEQAHASAAAIGAAIASRLAPGVQVVGGGAQQVGVVAEVPDAGVAPAAQQAPDGALAVAVVDR